ncbi:MAG: DeoR/GlpR family DNA-binding transcription regulator [Treponema sp.]|jgi:DeoR family galactitol utilization operon repressor|nr:DeoR/GlpR family DNA-binding transcription regulator [Treponema sp.]
MESAAREQMILGSLLEKGSITVAGLSRDLAVSEVTIRSDLNSLEKRGFLSRVHGGAVPSIHPHILERQNLRVEEKQDIARAAAALVRDGDTIMIEAGTTPALVCRYLGGRRDVHVITNSALAFAAAKNNPALKITLCGGEFRSSTESFVGPIAEETIRRFNVRIAFVGTDGFGVRGITTHLLEGGEVIKVMKERAGQTILLTDSSKYGRAGPVTIMPLSEADGIITDCRIPPEAAAEMGELVRIVEEKDAAVTRLWFKGAGKKPG